MIMITTNFNFLFTNFCVLVSFLTKLLKIGISFSTAVKSVVLAKLIIWRILFLTSFILALRVVVVVVVVVVEVVVVVVVVIVVVVVVIAKLVILGISYLTLFILASWGY